MGGFDVGARDCDVGGGLGRVACTISVVFVLGRVLLVLLGPLRFAGALTLALAFAPARFSLVVIFMASMVMPIGARAPLLIVVPYRLNDIDGVAGAEVCLRSHSDWYRVGRSDL